MYNHKTMNDTTEKVLMRGIAPTGSDGVAAGSIDDIRLTVSAKLDPERRVQFGQFMTPWPIARFMASMFQSWPSEMSLLDPGAGLGALSEAVALQFCLSAPSQSELSVTAYEIDETLLGHLSERCALLELFERQKERNLRTEIIRRDFITEGAFRLSFGSAPFTHAILNPPYKKIAANSEYRLLLRKEGIETVNLYTAFLGLAVALTKVGGEIVAIVPRSFCNGLYFKPFRHWLLDRVSIEHIHVFESRNRAFKDDEVLQENVIVRFVREGAQRDVKVSTSNDASFSDYSERILSADEIVKPNDEEKFIHVPVQELNGNKKLFSHSLEELGLDVATGPVVDFRVQAHWSSTPAPGTAPLLYTHHFRSGQFKWPLEHKKPNALYVNADTKKWLLPRGWYTITKRFSSKEERRRLVAYVVNPLALDFDYYGFENHLNVIHSGKRGLSADLARGMAIFLNSTIVDQHFRAFSGHTQVNATDLRTMRFPDKAALVKFGKWATRHPNASQTDIDSLVESVYG